MKRGLLALALLGLVTGCAARVAPATSTLSVACFEALGVEVWADAGSACPRQDSVAKRVRRVEARHGVSLTGASVTVVAGEILCAGQRAYGCTHGDAALVVGGWVEAWTMQTLEHELRHVAINRLGGQYVEREHAAIDRDRLLKDGAW